MSDGVIDPVRYPTLSPAGADVLRFMREHEAAPRFRNQSGNRLFAEDVAYLRAFEDEVATARIDWPADGEPPWVNGFVARCQATVPHFRSARNPPHFAALPTTSRADLSRDIARFIPDDVPLERMIHFRTSGTTGHPLLLPSHPRVAGSYLAYHKRALQRFGISLQHGRGQVGVVLLGFQEKCFTYTSVTPTMDESGLAKINLHPNDWRRLSDREHYLEALAPEVLTGDPISFLELLRLPVRLQPRALLSTSMALSHGLRAQLEARFGCPVLDLYSMNEAGPVAVFDPRLESHVLLQPQLFVEILDPQGHRLPSGERGEITLTGGFNFCLPLLRYRTGDFAAREKREGEWVLVDLQGRPAVRFVATDGTWKNNIEVTHALQAFSLAQYTLHQNADRSLVLRYRGAESKRDLVQALERVFGATAKIVVNPLSEGADKVVQYTSDLPQP